MSTQPEFDEALKTWEEREAARKRLAEEILPLNKARLLSALREAGISDVTVNYDGSGDEGRIESVIAEAGADEATLPAILLDLSYPHQDGGRIETRQLSLPDAIAEFAEDLVCRLYPWWEDGDGAYGEVIFDVAAGAITLEHNARYVAVNSFEHEI